MSASPFGKMNYKKIYYDNGNVYMRVNKIWIFSSVSIYSSDLFWRLIYDSLELITSNCKLLLLVNKNVIE